MSGLTKLRQAQSRLDATSLVELSLTRGRRGERTLLGLANTRKLEMTDKRLALSLPRASAAALADRSTASGAGVAGTPRPVQTRL